MNNNEQSTNDAFGSLKQKKFESNEHMNQLETELMSKYRSANSLSFVVKHKVLLIWICALLVGSSAVAAGTALIKHRLYLYDIKISRNGEILSMPKIIVEEGQKASIKITGGDQDFEMEILKDGSIIYHGDEDIEVDVTVEEIKVNKED